MHFLCVYIREAHPNDGWQVMSNVRSEIVYDEPTTEAERAEVAQVCVLRLNLHMPMVLDAMDDAVDAAYAAMPERLYVIDAAGHIAWRSEMGPFGFDPDAWEQQIAAQV